MPELLWSVSDPIFATGLTALAFAGWTYMLASAALRMTYKPYLLGGLAMLWGYASAALGGRPRYGEPGFRAFLRRYHGLVLSRGKAEAVRIIETEYERRWRPLAADGLDGARS